VTFQSGKFADSGKLYSQIAAQNPKVCEIFAARLRNSAQSLVLACGSELGQCKGNALLK